MLPEPTQPQGFQVDLEVFSGPFDLLLSLISRHRLDITEVALAEVTDDFLEYVAAMEEFDLSAASEFLVVAATLLDLKAARLLPRGETDSDEDLELLEARDLLFARLLAYKAFKDASSDIGGLMDSAGRAYPRDVSLEPQFAALLPELVMSVGPDALAMLAAKAMAPKEGPPSVQLTHLHSPTVSVRDEGDRVMRRLRSEGRMTFRSLIADAAGLPVVIARFLALLDLFRSGAVSFEQPEALGELHVRWSGGDEDFTVADEYDETVKEVSSG